MITSPIALMTHSAWLVRIPRGGGGATRIRLHLRPLEHGGRAAIPPDSGRKPQTCAGKQAGRMHNFTMQFSNFNNIKFQCSNFKFQTSNFNFQLRISSFKFQTSNNDAEPELIMFWIDLTWLELIWNVLKWFETKYKEMPINRWTHPLKWQHMH